MHSLLDSYRIIASADSGVTPADLTYVATSASDNTWSSDTASMNSSTLPTSRTPSKNGSYAETESQSGESVPRTW